MYVSEKQTASTIRFLQSKKSSLAASHTTQSPKTKHADMHKGQTCPLVQSAIPAYKPHPWL